MKAAAFLGCEIALQKFSPPVRRGHENSAKINIFTVAAMPPEQGQRFYNHSKPSQP
jgi:hypothetical protein